VIRPRHGLPSRCAARLAAAGLPALLAAAPAHAYWELIPQAEVGITYEDNPRYLTDEAAELLDSSASDDATGVITDLVAELRYNTPASEVLLKPRLRDTNYLKGNDDLNNDDLYVDLLGSRGGQLGSVALRAQYQDTGLRTSEFESAVPDNPDDPPPVVGGSGRFSDDTQETWNVQPSLNYQLSTRNVASVSALFTRSTYNEDDDDINRYVDYKYSSVEVSVRHVLNEKNYFVAALNGGGFTTDDPDSILRNSTDSFGITAAYERVFSDTLSGSLTVGVNRSAIDVSFGDITVVDNEERNFVGSLELRRRAELTTMNFSIASQIAPRSDGTEVVQEQARFFIDRRVTSRLGVNLSALYSQESAVGQNSANTALRQDRDYFTGTGGLSWRLTETLSIFGTYSYTSDTTDVPGGGNVHQTNNRVFVGVRYRGTALRR